MLEIRSVTKSFDDNVVLQDVSLDIEAGEVVAMLGPSGSGKTTLLRIVAGLETADAGSVHWRGSDLANIAVHERRFGMVFQDFALFPHKDVRENIAFGLRMADWSAEAIGDRIDRMLALVGLVGFGARSVYELSGGEQQRVALARALAPSPRLLLLDEPLGALDRALRERLIDELRQILRQAGSATNRPEGITAIYVTHDQAEAFAIADRVVVINEGRIEQVDTPLALYRLPQTAFVARFLGMENLLPGRLDSQDPLRVQTDIGTLIVGAGSFAPETGGRTTVLIRPDAGRLNVGPGDPNQLEGTLVRSTFRGRYLQVSIRVNEEVTLKLELEVDAPLPPVGSTLHFALTPGAVALLPMG